MDHLQLEIVSECKGGACPCPTVYSTNRQSFVVRGRRVAPNEKRVLTLGPGEDIVEVPYELLATLAERLHPRAG